MPRHPQLNDSPTLKKYRELLGVSESASTEDLKKAYHARAFLYHPDRNSDPQAPAQFQQVREAFENLMDPQRVQSLKQNHLKERLFDFCIEGLEISFGAFFGHRVYAAGEQRLPRELRIGRDPGPENQSDIQYVEKVYVEEDRSILDHSAYDNIEVVYAGRFTSSSDETLLTEQRVSAQGQLPWVLVNNKGILEFLKGDYEKALRSYEELNSRIANNIIFMYREALCRIILAFQNPERTLLGGRRPNRAQLKKGIQLLKRCIQIGESREVGKQRCVLIRKILADVLAKSGSKRAAKNVWKKIRTLQPNSVEANLKSGAKAEAAALIKKKTKVAAKLINRGLLKSGN
jgi:tetratricopeptide (TPR) repeat protein